MRTFFSYREEDSDIVHRVKRLMLSSEPEIVALWEERLSVQDFLLRMDEELPACSSFVLFLADELGLYQRQELDTFWQLMTQGQATRRIVIVFLCERAREEELILKNKLTRYGRLTRVRLPGTQDVENLFRPTASVKRASDVSPSKDTDSVALGIAKDLTQALGVPWQFVDGLPLDPHLFKYEKDIIQHYQDAARLFPNGIHAVEKDNPDKRIAWEIYQKWLKGCPGEWLDVPQFRPPRSLSGIDFVARRINKLWT